MSAVECRENDSDLLVPGLDRLLVLLLNKLERPPSRQSVALPAHPSDENNEASIYQKHPKIFIFILHTLPHTRRVSSRVVVVAEAFMGQEIGKNSECPCFLVWLLSVD